MKELLIRMELLYGMKKLGETFWVRVGGKVGQGEIRMAAKEPAVVTRTET